MPTRMPNVDEDNELFEYPFRLHDEQQQQLKIKSDHIMQAKLLAQRHDAYNAQHLPRIHDLIQSETNFIGICAAEHLLDMIEARTQTRAAHDRLKDQKLNKHKQHRQRLTPTRLANFVSRWQWQKQSRSIKDKHKHTHMADAHTPERTDTDTDRDTDHHAAFTKPKFNYPDATYCTYRLMSHSKARELLLLYADFLESRSRHDMLRYRMTVIDRLRYIHIMHIMEVWSILHDWKVTHLREYPHLFECDIGGFPAFMPPLIDALRHAEVIQYGRQEALSDVRWLQVIDKSVIQIKSNKKYAAYDREFAGHRPCNLQANTHLFETSTINHARAIDDRRAEYQPWLGLRSTFLTGRINFMPNLETTPQYAIFKRAQQMHVEYVASLTRLINLRRRIEQLAHEYKQHAQNAHDLMPVKSESVSEASPMTESGSASSSSSSSNGNPHTMHPPATVRAAPKPIQPLDLALDHQHQDEHEHAIEPMYEPLKQDQLHKEAVRHFKQANQKRHEHQVEMQTLIDVDQPVSDEIIKLIPSHQR